jgi:glyoxylase-like metal-dependent hydrolase (beta-lactamase superfamily II)
MLKVSRFGPVVRFDLARDILGRGRYWTTAYLIDGLMVDTGCAHTAHELTRALEGQQISTILNTHSHEDHVGANAEIKEGRAELEIRAHTAALPVLEHPQSQDLQLYRRLFWGLPRPSTAREIGDGEHLRTIDYRFEVMHTPGHSPDHLCLYERDQGWLFSGDLYVGGAERALRSSYDIWGIIASLKEVAHLPLRMLFPGGARVRENPNAALREKVEYLEACGQQVLELHRRGWGTRAIARHLFGGWMAVELITCGDFSRRHLVESYLRCRETEAEGRPGDG